MLNLEPGTIVRALRDLDPQGANVAKGDLGVVTHVANYYEDGYGPIVHWFRVVEDEAGFPLHRVGTGGCCNVYEGDVEVVLDPLDP